MPQNHVVLNAMRVALRRGAWQSDSDGTQQRP
eukprot:CAMPEP_0169138428 /NCGR_PEP_ID=MMETSP1015-20121227/42240_1 /TAXON_ID=342587 /ORGANISM="Karlodinium micrum, Strain CCMP2283" /LENGTH=31 /DNA_ID= /DNA_START= /DNA_END= /DNA_ORIENTATION=